MPASAPDRAPATMFTVLPVAAFLSVKLPLLARLTVSPPTRPLSEALVVAVVLPSYTLLEAVMVAVISLAVMSAVVVLLLLVTV